MNDEILTVQKESVIDSPLSVKEVTINGEFDRLIISRGVGKEVSIYTKDSARKLALKIISIVGSQCEDEESTKFEIHEL